MDSLLFDGYELLTALGPFLVLLVPLVSFYRKRNIRITRTACVLIVVFAVYVIGVYHFTGAGTLYEGLRFRLDTGHNLIPFSHTMDPVGYLLNLLLFVPLGLLVSLIWERLDSFPRILGVGAVFSLFIELTQLLNIRATDIDDILMNTAGTVVGFLFFRVASLAAGERFRHSNVPVPLFPAAVLIPYLGRFFLYNDMGLARLLYGF